jgi:phosphoserine phosphatase RsbU/P
VVENAHPDLPNEDLEDLYENAPCGYISLGPDGRIVKSNRTLSTWLAVEVDELLGKRLRDLLNTAGRIFYETHFAPLLRMQGFFNEVALDLKMPDGTKLAVIANAKEKRDADGLLLFTRVTLFQATERRRYERELVEARVASDEEKARIRAALADEHHTAILREQFVAVLGHDLRNPLASVSAAARLLRKETATSKGATLLDLMQGSVERMSGLIDDVLDFARGRLGSGLAVQMRSENLEPILLHVVEELRSSNAGRVIDARIMLGRPIESDGGRIGQMVSNLLGNAIAYGIATEPVRLSATIDGDVLEIWIANSGTPISEEAQVNLFRPFFRGDGNGNRQGLGLGLHIASEISVSHGGLLTVASDVDETRFTFRMPIKASGPVLGVDVTRLPD